MLLCLFYQVVNCLVSCHQILDVRSSWMQCVPLGFALISPAFPRSIDPEPRNSDIPYGSITSDQYLFGEPNPDLIQHKPPALEVFQVQICGVFYGLCMLGQPFTQDPR
ncbi:MAG: hypothetical protein M2R45_05035 [Verrucomicrobia subdivision 3 bacterium]|nr:hypothetical protein [Limisphaerales bacterium]MCS1412563.1 hypothetical protein [Limisphaerales bacterium]